MIKNIVRDLKYKNIILGVVLIITLITSVYSVMTYGRTVLNADSAVFNTYADAVWKHHSLFPKTWNYANGDVWSPEDPVAMVNVLIHPFVRMSDVSRVFVSAIQLFFVLFVFYYFFHNGLKSNAWLIAFPLTTIFLFGIGLYILYDACYIVYYFWEPFTVYCLIRLRQVRAGKKFNRYAVGIVILFSIISIHGARSIADYILPAVITLCYFLYLEYNSNNELKVVDGFKNLIYYILICVFPMIVGLAFYKYIAKTRNINDTTTGFLVFPSSLSDLGKSLCKTISIFFKCFGYNANAEIISVEGIRNFISIILVLLLCVIIPIIQAVRINKESEAVKIFFAYAMIHNSILFLFCVVCSSIVNFYHMTSSILLFILVSSRFLYEYCIENGGRLRSIVWVLMFSFATVVECIGTYNITDGWKSVLEDRRRVADVLVENGLTKGYATFWNAYSTQMYSGSKVKMAAVGIDERALTEYRWLNDTEDYKTQKTKTFIMLSDGEMDKAKDIGLILGAYEEPIDIIKLKDVSLYHNKTGFYRDNINIYVYENDYAQYINNGSDDGEVIPREMSFNNYGVRTEEAIMLLNNGLVYGPYSTLIEGDYVVKYYGENLSNCNVDVISEKDDEAVSFIVDSISDDCIAVRLHISNRVEAVQYRVLNSTNEEVKLTKIGITKE